MLLSSRKPLFLAWGGAVDAWCRAETAGGDETRDPLRSLRSSARALEVAGHRVARLEIEPLGAGWRGRPDLRGPSFHSGCAPLLALHRARELLADDEAEAVLVTGADPLCTGYDRVERARLMGVFGEISIPDAYTALARLQMERWSISAREYRRLQDLLLENYSRTARRRGLAVRRDRGQRQATALFRYADCAYPYVDFEGGVLLGTERAAESLGLAPSSLPQLLGVAVELREDGPDHARQIVGYPHLAAAYRRTCREAGLDYAARFLSGDALLEAYTCFPPVPLGFLMATGIARGFWDLERVIAGIEITVTGGMNLAGAPWNNPALNALVVMLGDLVDAGPTGARAGLVHGNGGLGGYQGVAILACPREREPA